MEDTQKSEKKKSCASCGAELRYKPGSQHVVCAYCGYEEFIEHTKSSFEELELRHYLEVVGNHAHTESIELLHCKNCGANQHVEENYKSLHCVYCGEPLIREDMSREGWILPGALVPFQFDRKHAQKLFKKWVAKLWFAPDKLKKAALDPGAIHGIYLPYWTFDAQLSARYEGQRGDYYYETRMVRTKKGMERRQVRKTRWTHAAGEVSGFVDDILISASNSTKREVPQNISSWDTKTLVPFHTDYLSGFVTEKYTVSLKEGHRRSFEKAKDIAYNWIRRDIGGDTQRIHHADINLSEETFKHILLPIYLSAYRFKNKEYAFFINGQTGLISGTRPYSFWKIFLLVLLIIVVVVIISILAK